MQNALASNLTYVDVAIQEILHVHAVTAHACFTIVVSVGVVGISVLQFLLHLPAEYEWHSHNIGDVGL
jgi:hypothetical protein